MKTGFEKKNSLFTATFIITSSILLIVLLATIFAGVIAPYPPEKLDIKNKLQGMSAQHIFGTDKVGRDIFSRILYGGRTTLVSAFLVVLISVVIGVPAGLICGYYGKKIDGIIMNIWNIILGVPSILLAFMIMSFTGRGIKAGIIAIGIVYIPMISRLTRSVTMIEKNKNYVEASKVLGYSNFRIITLHILPNCIPTLMAELTLDLAYAILDLAGLSFLGLGVQAPQSDWGYMLSDAQQFLTSNPIQAIVPGTLIIVVVISLNLLSNEVMGYIDPKLRSVISFKRYNRLQKRFEDRQRRKAA